MANNQRLCQLMAADWMAQYAKFLAACRDRVAKQPEMIRAAQRETAKTLPGRSAGWAAEGQKRHSRRTDQ